MLCFDRKGHDFSCISLKELNPPERKSAYLLFGSVEFIFIFSYSSMFSQVKFLIKAFQNRAPLHKRFPCVHESLTVPLSQHPLSPHLISCPVSPPLSFPISCPSLPSLSLSLFFAYMTGNVHFSSSCVLEPFSGLNSY